MNILTIFLISLITPIEKIGELPFFLIALGLSLLTTVKPFFFNRMVLYGSLSAILVFSSFRLAFITGSIVHLKNQAALRSVAPITITDRDGVILYKTTVAQYFARLSPSEEYKRAPTFVDYTLQKLKEQYGEELLENGVYVRTTLESELQNSTQEMVLEQMFTANTAIDGSMIVTDSQTGDILAFVSSVHYFDQPVSQSVNPEIANTTPFLTIIDSSGKFIYKNHHAANDFPINENDLISSTQWKVNNSLVTTMDHTTVKTWLGMNENKDIISKNTGNTN